MVTMIMNSRRRRQLNLIATAVVLFALPTACIVDASCSRTSAAAVSVVAATESSASKRYSYDGASSDRQLRLRPSRRVGVLALRNGDVSSSQTMVNLLRGGSSSSEDGDQSVNRDNNEDAVIDATLIDQDVFDSSSAIKQESRGGGWKYGLFGKKKSSNTENSTLQVNDEDGASTATGDSEDGGGSIEITMNTTSDGKNNVKVEIDAPNTIREIQGKLYEAMETSNIQKNINGSTRGTDGGGGSIIGSSIAHQVRARGGNTAQGASSQSAATTSAATGGGGGHISSKFPISTSELPHFFSMSFMMFLFIYVFTTVRDTKDTLVVSNCGAEAIPFLKLYAVMPCATAFIVIYSKLSNLLDKRSLFYVTLIPFFIFYGVFAFVLFPNRDVIHFPTLAEGMMGGGEGVTSAAINLIRYWSFSLYFIVSELWASAGVPLLFWQVSDGITFEFGQQLYYLSLVITKQTTDQERLFDTSFPHSVR
jgi:hypothetical protein